MSLNAKFLADFSSFQQACAQAQVSLKTFETGANQVEKQLSKMGNSFSGAKVIQDATLMSAAVDKLGGTSGLTDKELRKLGTTVNEAAEKMRRMGLDVPANFQKIAAETANITSKQAQLVGTLRDVAGAFGIAFGVQAIVGFGRELLRMGDDIVRTADRTGLLTGEVQRLNFIASQSGNTIDELTGAIGQMQNRLASGDKSAVGAVKALGISFEDLRKAGPYQQLQLIADAIAQIPNPASRAQVAMDLFGRSGIAILPTLTANFRELGNAAPVMSDNVVKSLDKAGDAFARFQLSLKVGVANSYNFLSSAFDQLTAFALRFGATLDDSAASLLEWAQKIPGASKVLPNLSANIKELRDHAQLARDTATQLTTAIADVGATTGRNIVPFERMGDALEKTGKQAKGLTDLTREAEGALEKFAQTATTIQSRDFSGAGQGPADLVNFLRGTQITPNTGSGNFAGIGTGPAAIGNKTFSTDRGSLFGGIAGGAAQSVVSALQGGGNVAQSVAGSIGSQLGANVVGKFGSAITGTLGKVFGGALNAVLPGIGALAGPLIGLVGKLFGKSEESAKVSPLRDEFFKMQGGLETLNPKVQALTGNLTLVENIFKAKTVEQYNAALKELNDTLAFQDQALQTLTQTAERYGFTLEELGPALSRQELDKQAQQLYKDFQILTAGGIDHVAVLDKMSESVNAYVQKALAMGIEVPEAMRPMLEDMAKSGLLLDASGKAFTSVEDAGINFALTMSDGFKALISEVKKLTDAIARGLGLAIENIPQPEITGTVHWNVDNVPTSDGFDGASTGGLVSAFGVQHFGKGGRVLPFRGSDTVPAMLTPGELVLNANQQHAVSALLRGGGTGGAEEIHIYLDGAELEATITRRQSRRYALQTKAAAA